VTDPDWTVEERDGVRLVHCVPLGSVRGVRHAFSTRATADGERFVRAAGLGACRPTLLRQVHGSRVIDVAEYVEDLAADAVVARFPSPRWAPSVRWADCVPVLLAAADGAAVAAVHAGWRGVAAGVVAAAVSCLQERGVRPRSLVAALGPAIGGCCYEVGQEVLTDVARAAGVGVSRLTAGSGSQKTLDLRRAVRFQLERAGLEEDSIHPAPWCTACSPDLFFSYRRDGARAGRQMACIGWAPPG